MIHTMAVRESRETQRSLIRLISFNTMLFSALVILMLGSIWLVVEVRDFQQQFSEFEATLIEERRSSVENEVMRALDYIRYSERTRIGRARDEIENRVSEAHRIASGIYDRYAGVLPRDEVQTLIIEVLRTIRYNQGEGYYFISELNGRSRLWADRPEREGRDLYNYRDAEGKLVVQDMIDMVRTNGAGFIRYRWSKPGNEGHDHTKLAFVRYFEPYDWYIGTGAYLDEEIEKVQEEVLEWISRIRFGEEGYLFIVNRKGEIISHYNPELIDQPMLGYRDQEGTPVLQRILSIAQESERGGFLRYYWEKPSSGREALKLSYVRGLERWGWAVGAGVYLDSIEAEIDKARLQFISQTRNRVITILILYLMGVGLSILWTNAVRRRIQVGVERFVDFFQVAADEYLPLDEDSVHYLEFRRIAAYANRMVRDQIRSRREINASLREKETLLKEIHHRVKNNLQVISSILSLQSDYVEDERILEYFRESKGRIASMALVHEELYETESLAEVDFEEYCRRFVPSLINSYSRGASITLQFDTQQVMVPIDAAVPLGLILNELITNAIKHAFPERESGTVTVRCRCEGDKLHVAVEDDGCGLPLGFDPEKNDSLGMQLIVNLTLQIRGELSIESDGGSRFHLRSPLDSCR